MPANVAPLRRRPVQQRSAQRVERMLESCAELIDELGHDGVTTTLIAERAGVAVGSLYQFFPDKRAVVQALTTRNLERYLAMIGKRLEAGEFDHWWDAVDVALDAYVEMHRSVPGFAQVRFGAAIDRRGPEGSRDNGTVVSEGLARMLAQRFDIPLEAIRLPVAVSVEIADGILNLAFRRPVFAEAEVITEARTIVHAYLSGRLTDNWITVSAGPSA